MQKFLNFKVLVDVVPTKNSEGKGVWRATSSTLKMSADGDTPDKAISQLESNLRDAENSAGMVKNVKPKVAVKESKEDEMDFVETMSKAELLDYCDKVGVDTKGLSKAELKNALREHAAKGKGNTKEEEPQDDNENSSSSDDLDFS